MTGCVVPSARVMVSVLYVSMEPQSKLMLYISLSKVIVAEPPPRTDR